MDNKIMILSLLLCIVVVVTAIYVVVNQSSFGEGQQSTVIDNGDVSEQDVAEEIDDLFLDEDDEIEIGEMV